MDRQDWQSEPTHPDDVEARRVAERLDQLSMGEVERIIQRALEIQSSTSDLAPDQLDRETLRRVAAEMDISPQHLEQALVEELAAAGREDPGLLDRIFIPRRISASGVAGGTLAEVDAAVDDWMVGQEGMVRRATRKGEVVWEKDPSLAASVRRGLRLSQATGDLRQASTVTTRVRPATETRHIVGVEADVTPTRRLAIALATGVLALSAGVGVAVAAFTDGVAGDAAAVASTAAAGAIGFGSIVLGFKMWAGKVRAAVERAVEAISSPASIPTPGGLRDAVINLVGQVWGSGGWGRRRG